MSVHKLTAGDGYAYLTRQVAAHDATARGRSTLSDYYSEKGEQPGHWMGRGLSSVPHFDASTPVTQAQMAALYGEGRHPDADRIEREAIGAGATAAEVEQASRLGAPFPLHRTASDFAIATAVAYREYNQQHGRASTAAIPQQTRAEIRTTIARRMFTEEFGRAPLSDRELSGHLARLSRQGTTAVAGYDLTFSPVKSISTLWAIAPRPIAEIIEQAHHDAVADTIGWLEDHASYTRAGRGGVAQLDVDGLIAAAFTHRDSRDGDPDLHTHVAVSNKVATTSDGTWRALDGRHIFRNTVAASERYNTRMEAFLRERIGVEFADRPAPNGKRPVREIVGIGDDLPAAWSRRRAAIDARRGELAADFQRAHGRVPTAKEAIELAQQANLETRQCKHEPRSYAEQRATWRHEAEQVLGGPDAITAMVRRTVRPRQRTSHRQPSADWIEQTADTIVETLQQHRATWRANHVRAEAERQVRAAAIAPTAIDTAVEALVTATLHRTRSIPLTGPAGPAEPAPLRRTDGRSVFEVAGAREHTSARIIDAEQQILHTGSLTNARAVTTADITAAFEASEARGIHLNAGQQQLVRDLATSARAVQLALAPAGTGKTTAMRALVDAWRSSGGTVLGLAPSAAASEVLHEDTGIDTDTLDKLIWHLDHPNQPAPEALAGIDARSLVIIDEAAMASTINLARVIEHITARGGAVRLIGDDHQLSAIGAGGALRDLAHHHGAASLSEVMRFKTATDAPDHSEAAASLALRNGEPAALAHYLDRDRVHVGDTSTATDALYTAWRTDRDAGRDSLMLAPTRELVIELNTRARRDRITDGRVHGPSIGLSDGTNASTGDLIITRRNDRRLRLSPTNWVKNGDRWHIESVHPDGSLQVTHARRGTRTTLPAAYVREHVDLGYAATIHAAQGVTTDTSHTLLTGSETRQLLYVAMSRGRYENHAYLVTVSDGDPHTQIHPETLLPPTPTDMLTEILTRDARPVSATTAQRELHSPTVRLGAEAAQYLHALDTAAVDVLGADDMHRIDAFAETIHPGLTTTPAYPTLRARLALVHLNGKDAEAELRAAVDARELDTALDPAAVLVWRIDGSHPAHRGPLRWLPAIPSELAAHPTWGTYLTEKSSSVTDLASQVRTATTTWSPTTAPAWSMPFLDEPRLLGDLAVWRAAQAIDDTDMRPTGRDVPYIAEQREQRELDKSVTRVLGDANSDTSRWYTLAESINHRITNDDYWPTLARHLTTAARSGIDIAALARDEAAIRPLPDDMPAAALWWRLAAHLSPAAATGASTAPPAWSHTLTDLLGASIAARVMADPSWPSLVAAIDQAERAHWSAGDALQTSYELLQSAIDPRDPLRPHEYGPALTWRISALTAPSTSSTTRLDRAPDDVDHLPTSTPEDESAYLDALIANPPPEDFMEPLTDAPPDDADPFQSRPADLHLAVPRPAPPSIPAPPEADSATSRILELNHIAATYYQQNYPDSWAAAHLLDRFGSDLSEHDWLQPGYAPAGWTRLADALRAQHSLTDDELLEAGLVTRSSTGRIIDRFRDRLVFPISTTLDEQHTGIVGFTARRRPGADDLAGPKYLNTPHTPVFTKGQVLYGLTAEHAQQLRDGAAAVIVEGPTDAIAVTLAGRGQYIGLAPLGTAFTDQHATLLAGLAAPVLLGTDNDAAGRSARLKTFWRLAAHNIAPQHIVLPPGADPASVYQQGGASAVQAALRNHSDLAAHLIAAHLRTRPHPGTVEGDLAALRDVAEIAGAAPPATWLTYADQIADQIVLHPSTITSAISDAGGHWSTDPAAHARLQLTRRDIYREPQTARDPAGRWTAAAHRIDPGLLDDPHWPTLASRLDSAPGNDVDQRLVALAAVSPLDPQHPARDLDHRLLESLPEHPDVTNRPPAPDRPQTAARMRHSDQLHAQQPRPAAAPAPAKRRSVTTAPRPQQARPAAPAPAQRRSVTTPPRPQQPRHQRGLTAPPPTRPR